MRRISAHSVPSCPARSPAWRLVAIVGCSLLLAISAGCKKRTGDGFNKPEDPDTSVCTSAPAIEPAEDDVTFTVGTFGTVMFNNTNSCPPDQYTITPDLPDGLVLGPDGTISGTPTAISPETDYTVSASNDNGSADTTITISVFPAAPAGLVYPDLLAIVVDEPIAPITPSSSGGPIEMYETVGVLPIGLTLDPDTGVIEGTPTEVGMNSVSIRGINVSGDSVATIMFAVFPQLRVSGFAQYFDIDRNGAAGPGDQVVVPFNQDIEISGASVEDLLLPVDGDSFGTGAMVALGPGPAELTITLGDGPSLKSRQRFVGEIQNNSPSGLDVAITAPDRIESAYTGSDAVSSFAIDLVPGFVSTSQSIGPLSTDAQSADLNGDGILDLVLAIDGPNEVWFGLGNGNFADSGLALGAEPTNSVLIEDFDADGDLDLIFGSASPSQVELWLNDGAGDFTLVTQDPLPNVLSIVAGDLDGDGDSDLIAGENYYRNLGGGMFTNIGGIGAGGGAHTLALGDLDRDGDLDIFHGTAGAPGHIFLNNGNATFVMLPQEFDADAIDSAIGDLDQDGVPDLCIAYENNLQVWAGNGDGTFAIAHDLGDAGCRSVLLYDVDQDGKLDAFFGNEADETQLWLGEGDATFTESGTFFEGTVVEAGDIDSDGDVDYTSIAVPPALDVRLFANSLSGTWGSANFVQSGPGIAPGETFEVAIGDLDLDGDIDFVAARVDLAAGGAPNRVYLNDGTGEFVQSPDELGMANTEDVAFIDVDRDGDLDLFCGNREAPNRLYLNDGSGGFTDSGETFLDDDTACLAVGDFNRDGIADLAIGNRGDNRVLFGDGTTLVDTGQLLIGGQTYDLVPADVDADGDLDLIEGTSVGRHNKVWFNDGVGVFTPSVQEFGFMEVREIAVGDVNRDGHLDLVLGRDGVGPGSWPNALLLGDSTGNFTLEHEFAISDRTIGLALGDVDADGDLDLLVANVGPDFFYENDGTGTFGPAQELGLDNGESFTVKLADFDADGDLDSLIGSRSEFDRVLKNQ